MESLKLPIGVGRPDTITVYRLNQAIVITRGNVSHLASILGVTRGTVSKLLDKGGHQLIKVEVLGDEVIHMSLINK
ncbi:hypothetical protein F353_gp52 [Vibrio phage CP-T1]|uniref:hypothetical protein n=1 Tax=Vibrio phage CP-T1 TaxID=10689 RepID=UPI0002536CED|nr:hypothetical protein F353_gp52 [Vibrio phage CP-T1]AFC22434.1 hypothetical protein CP-T1_0052 [Vibrio phage CP-T1]AIA08712.1 hypothetical protein SBVc24_0023 [Vibrio phage 24]